MKSFHAVLVAGAVTLGACGQGHDNAAASKPMQPSAVTEATMSDKAKDFFPAAASGGLLEVQASKLALTQSQDEAVKTFAQTMVDDHTKAGTELAALASKKGVTLPSALSDDDQKLLDDLKGKQGPDFDKAYKKVMVDSHKQAVSLFDNAAKDSTDADVKAWAGTTLPALQHHGTMAEQLPPSASSGATS